jgi:prevent-host-death family protein
LNENVEASEAAIQLTSLLERVAKGERFTITRHGKPVAQLAPVEHRDPERIKAAIAAFVELSAGLRLDGDWREFRDAGRKW